MTVQPSPDDMQQAIGFDWHELLRWTVYVGAVVAALTAIATFFRRFTRWTWRSLSRWANDDAFRQIAAAAALVPKVERMEQAISEQFPAMTTAIEGCTATSAATLGALEKLASHVERISDAQSVMQQHIAVLADRTGGVPGGVLPSSSPERPARPFR